MEASQVECGDIIKTPFGIMLVEKIAQGGKFIGHELKKRVEFWSRDGSGIEVLNSDFRYRDREVEAEQKKLVVERLTGQKEWKKYDPENPPKKLPGEIDVRECSQCNYCAPFQPVWNERGINYPFCPKCGSRMKDHTSCRLV